MIALIDYGMGNLFSVSSSLNFLGADVKITADPEIISKADKIILPGVGAFRDASILLKETGLGNVIKEQVSLGKPLMGICLGMQLLFDQSCEYGNYEGLGLIPGSVVPIKGNVESYLKIPHMGWNSLEKTGNHPVLENVSSGDFVYFVHSYYVETEPKNLMAVTNYGGPLTAVAGKENVIGCQFHPEKSGKTGLKILESFCKWDGRV